MGTLKVRVGGAWVNVGAGNEVAVQPDDPAVANPAVELWYDTDAPSSLQQAPYGLEAAKPPAPVTPFRYFATDTKRDWLWDGSTWWIMDEPWQSFTPTWITNGGTNPTMGTGAVQTGKYRRQGNSFEFYQYQKFGTTGMAAGSGVYLWTVPFPLYGFQSAGGGFLIEGGATGYDFSSGNTFHTNRVGVLTVGSTSLFIHMAAAFPIGGTSNINQGFPWAWGQSDDIELWGKGRLVNV